MRPGNIFVLGSVKRTALVLLAMAVILSACGTTDTPSSKRDEGQTQGQSAAEAKEARAEQGRQARKKLREARLETARERRKARQVRLARQRRRERLKEQREKERDEAAALAASTSNCTDGYDPCLTPAPDYDCAGGGDDGPKYTGCVTVTGSDPYDLDSDGDGAGCES